MRGTGFEPADLYRTAPSTLRRWPGLATHALRTFVIPGGRIKALSFALSRRSIPPAVSGISLGKSGAGRRRYRRTGEPRASGAGRPGRDARRSRWERSPIDYMSVSISNRAPPSRPSVTVISQPCASVMSRTIDRPSPVPSLPEKPWSRTVLRSDSGIPLPSSTT
jgi:hypothetical protein